MEKKDRVKTLIAKKSNPFTVAHAPMLEAMPEDQFKLLEEFEGEIVEKVVEKIVEKEVPAAAVPAAVAPVVATTVDAYVAQAPVEIREVLVEGVRAAAAKRSAVVKTLKDSGRCDFSDAELAVMSINELDRMAKLLGAPVAAAQPVDMVGQAPRAAGSGGDSEKIEKPRSLSERLAKTAASATH